MFNPNFIAHVRHTLINVFARNARLGANSNDKTTEDVTVFVDLQNFHYFLKENCRVHPTRVHVPGLIRAYVEQHGMRLKELRIYTGVHDPRRDEKKATKMKRRVRWFESEGAVVRTLPLVYYHDPITKELRFQEKGVDVLLASELLQAVMKGARRVMVVSQDHDLAQGIRIAADVAKEQGYKLKAYSPIPVGMNWEHNGRCGIHGIDYTTRLNMDISLVRQFERDEEGHMPTVHDDLRPHTA